jgi:enoyl-[acyl-carrier protein] reductase I
MSGLMQGKRGLIMGLANDKSLAWGIARSCTSRVRSWPFRFRARRWKAGATAGRGAGQRSSDRLRRVGHGRAGQGVRRAEERWDTIDFVVHAIGFSDKTQLRGRYYDTTLDNFLMTMNISAYSLVAVTKRARDDAQWRLDPDADLLWRGKGCAPLQRDGRGQGGAGNQREVSGQ